MSVEHAGNAKIKFKCVPLLVHDRLNDLSIGKTYQLQLPSAGTFQVCGPVYRQGMSVAIAL